LVTEKLISKDLFISAMSEFKKYRPSGSLNYNNKRIFHSLKLRILGEKTLPISLA